MNSLRLQCQDVSRSTARSWQKLLANIEIPTLAVGLTIYLGFVAVTWFFNELPLLVAAPFASLLLAWQSSFQHETIHGHPTPSRPVNAVFGWPPLSLWLPYEVYRDTHLRHHRCKGARLTRPSEDPESHYLPPGALAVAGKAIYAIFWFNRTLLGRLMLGPLISVFRFWKTDIRRLQAGESARLWVWSRHAISVAIVLFWVVGMCRIPMGLYVLTIIYPSIALGQLRSYGEHRAHADPRLRTNVVETNPALSLLFLNNNLHIAHHAKPGMPWYELPNAWKAMKQDAIDNGAIARQGYRQLVRDHLLRPVIAAEYPAEAG
jgi:fatty acid desaturase